MTDGEKLKRVRLSTSTGKKCTQKKFGELTGLATAVIGNLETDKRKLTSYYRNKVYEATGAVILEGYDYPVLKREDDGVMVPYTNSHFLYWKSKKST